MSEPRRNQITEAELADLGREPPNSAGWVHDLVKAVWLYYPPDDEYWQNAKAEPEPELFWPYVAAPPG